MIKSVSNSITEYLRKNNSSLSLTDLMKIDYAIQMILGDLAKLIIISLMFVCLNQLPLFLFSYIILFSTRPLAGGIHCKTFWRCLAFSVMHFAIILISSILLPKFNTYFYVTFFIVSLVIIERYAPCANTKKPIKNKRLLKILSLISFTFWIIIFFTLSNIKMCNCILASTLIQIVQLIILNIKGDVSNAKIYKLFFRHAT
ncbi:accessory gene regulator B family protein [Clostridium sp.]|uniref:accessory gene regulator B family protein n=1 Tax=Clostridium sp. TaxID=1506 RepID=UPI00284D05C2|nr:accessory gene regulator B family protein [Clostridium sp.]MDR3595864.1 accessory gene regulator B family protein [Clostridium sp.]